MDFNELKKKVHINLDLHHKYRLENTEQDKGLVLDMRAALRRFSKDCFGLCINLSSPEVLVNEEKCLQTCISDSLSVYEELIKRHEV